MDYRLAIRQTLRYSDIFDYPLTKAELWSYLIFQGVPQRTKFNNALKKIDQKKGYFFLDGRESIVDKRIKRQISSDEKIILAKKISRILKYIPSIKFIGISGSVSMRNASVNDDIDLFIITSKGFLWTTRFLVILLLKILNKYRGYGEKKVKDKFCTNMFVDTTGLVFEKNLYTAHEIVQLMPIIDKKNIYKYFLSQNKWINEFMPNIKIPNISKYVDQRTLFLRLFQFTGVEKLMEKIQFEHMRRKISVEKITDNSLSFHPKDSKSRVLKRLS